MSNRTLKMIAVLTMLYDHLSRIFSPDDLFLAIQDVLTRTFPGQSEVWSVLYIILSFGSSLIGRLAAPIFMYCIVLGFIHTRNVQRYMARLLGFALISQLPYVLLFGIAEPRIYSLEPDPWGQPLNILFTLCLGLFTLWTYEYLCRFHTVWGQLAVAGLVAVGWLLPIEGGKGAVLIIFLLYWLRRLPKLHQAALWIIMLPLARWGLTSWLIEDFNDLSVRLTVIINLVGIYLGILLSLTYNGTKGEIPRWLQYGFYWFYPIHLLVIGTIGWFISI
ncbi:TraX family protein [Paenibacillus sp. FSL K6-1096]|uniref:TraX family protein n=1 Tax=Paenibacillus sp. FSL K6-1096 TaxID=2921460 RepID=UPI0030EDE9A9